MSEMKKLWWLATLSIFGLCMAANVSNTRKSGDKIVVQGRDGSTVSISALNNTLNVQSTNYTITSNDGYGNIFVTTGNSNRTITLPAVATAFNRKLFIKKVDSGTGRAIISVNGGSIDGASTNELITQYAFVELVSDGSIWQVLRAWDYIGQTTNTTTVAGTGNVYHDVGNPLSVPAGDWWCDAYLRYDRNGSTATAYINSFPGTATGNNGTQICNVAARAGGIDYNTSVSSTAWNTINFSFPGCRIFLTATTNVYQKGLYAIATNTNQFSYGGSIECQRRK